MISVVDFVPPARETGRYVSMKRKSILLICIVVLLATVAAGIFLYGRSANPLIAIDAEHFPDEIFRAYVSDYYDRDDDGMLDGSEIRAAINCTPKKQEIKSLQGIEFLTEVKSLDCSNNELERLDVSKNKKLEYLEASFNPLSELELGDRSALTELICYQTPLTRLDVKNCTRLKTLYCSRFEFTELDISDHPSLVKVHCSVGELRELKAHKCPALVELDCYDNSLTSLDLHGCSALVRLRCQHNPLTTLNLKGCDHLQNEPDMEGLTIVR
jgi:Leucine-rich repeat (LRR) protein